MKNTLKFLTWPAIAGLLAALLILDRLVLPQAGAIGTPSPGTASYAEAVRRASPAVVNIYTAKLVQERRSLARELFSGRYAEPRAPRQRVEESLGSGVIMSREGHILTNNHVISDVDAIQVLLHDGRLAKAIVIGTDPATDLAVLKIDLPDLQPVELGDSDLTRVGDVVLAIGNPLGFGNSVTQGIVSALGRYFPQQNRNMQYEDYIQTDAIIHLGNSGGALIDSQGRLLGINTLIYTAGEQGRASSPTGIGISLAIPVNLAVFVMQDLIDYGEVVRGWLGVSVEPVRRVGEGSLSAAQALAVSAMSEDSPAERAGIQLGDVITHINGDPITDGRKTMHQIAMLRPGEVIDVTVLRQQQSMELHAVVGTLRQSPTL